MSIKSVALCLLSLSAATVWWLTFSLNRQDGQSAGAHNLHFPEPIFNVETGDDCFTPWIDTTSAISAFLTESALPTYEPPLVDQFFSTHGEQGSHLTIFTRSVRAPGVAIAVSSTETLEAVDRILGNPWVYKVAFVGFRGNTLDDLPTRSTSRIRFVWFRESDISTRVADRLNDLPSLEGLIFLDCRIGDGVFDALRQGCGRRLKVFGLTSQGQVNSADEAILQWPCVVAAKLDGPFVSEELVRGVVASRTLRHLTIGAGASIDDVAIAEFARDNQALRIKREREQR